MGYIFNFHTQIIDITSPQIEVNVQELINMIRDNEDSFLGMSYTRIADATGKDDLGGGVQTGITLTLYPDWQLRFWAGSYTATIVNGNLVGGLNGDPVAYTAGVQVVLIQSAASTLVTGGSALTTEEHDKLMTGLDTTVPSAVWDEVLTNHLTAGTTGKTLKDVKTKATLASLK